MLNLYNETPWIRNFTTPIGLRPELLNYYTNYDNIKLFLIIADENSREQQFNVGRLYTKIQLNAHTQGLAVQSLSQPIEDYIERIINLKPTTVKNIIKHTLAELRSKALIDFANH